jgi:hypothetical protein
MDTNNRLVASQLEPQRLEHRDAAQELHIRVDTICPVYLLAADMMNSARFRLAKAMRVTSSLLLDV